MRALILTAVFICLFGYSRAQSIAIDFIELAGRNIIVHYNLDDGPSSNRQFLVQLYSSQDNYTTPLTRVVGDVGTEVTAGFDKKITWDITKELGDFSGNIALELRGRVFVPFVKITNIKEGDIYKHGRNYPLTWTSGNLSGQVNIELFNGDGERLWGENNIPNVGKFDLYIENNLKRGNDYTIKFTNSKDRNDVVYSVKIVIKPRIPLIAKIGAGILVGAAAAVLILNKQAKDELKPFPGPPSPNE